MPRNPLTSAPRRTASAATAAAALAVAALLFAPAATGVGTGTVTPNPHLDPGVVQGSCKACHAGHGTAKSPMLAKAQDEVCMDCHGYQGNADRQKTKKVLQSAARPTLLGQTFLKAYSHPITKGGMSRRDPGTVTCSSCHSPHRSSTASKAASPVLAVNSATRFGGVRKPSALDPTQFEYQLCGGCHGSAGSKTLSRTDLSRLFDPSSRSYHPVTSPSPERSRSVKPELAGREVNCTDCHGNDDATGPRGIHGSSVRGLLNASYTVTDGLPESAETYAFCYQCHDRKAILENSPFPQHRQHIVDLKASCATCHSAHGSVVNRALVRFGEETSFGSVSPSVRAGKVAFVSDGAGSGGCYLTCHGKDHGPLTYGSMGMRLAAKKPPVSDQQPVAAPSAVPGAAGASAPRPVTGAGTGAAREAGRPPRAPSAQGDLAGDPPKN